MRRWFHFAWNQLLELRQRRPSPLSPPLLPTLFVSTTTDKEFIGWIRGKEDQASFIFLHFLHCRLPELIFHRFPTDIVDQDGGKNTPTLCIEISQHTFAQVQTNNRITCTLNEDDSGEIYSYSSVMQMRACFIRLGWAVAGDATIYCHDWRRRLGPL